MKLLALCHIIAHIIVPVVPRQLWGGCRENTCATHKHSTAGQSTGPGHYALCRQYQTPSSCLTDKGHYYYLRFVAAKLPNLDKSRRQLINTKNNGISTKSWSHLCLCFLLILYKFLLKVLQSQKVHFTLISRGRSSKSFIKSLNLSSQYLTIQHLLILQLGPE